MFLLKMIEEKHWYSCSFKIWINDVDNNNNNNNNYLGK